MIRSLCLKIACVLLTTAMLFVTMLTLPDISLASKLRPASPQQHTTQTTPSFLPISAFHLRGIDGPYYTKGNRIYGSDNYPYLFHGIARDDLEYFCQGDGHYTAKDLAYMGLGNNSTNQTYWEGNVVRLPLSENFWLYGQPSDNCTSNQYQALVKKTVDSLTSMNLNVILNLQWTNAGGQAFGSGTQLAMPDADSITFWQQIAMLYASYPNVLFEIFNEPHIYSWPCWVNGCQIVGDVGTNNQHYTPYAGVGMQKLVDTVRATGATNLILVGGLDWGYNLSQLPTYHLRGNNIVYDTHPYDYYGKQPSNWEADFGTVSSLFPLFSAESGEYDCGTSYMSQLISYFDAHNISWVGWAWVVTNGNPCTYPQVVSNYTGKPVPGMGQLEYQHLSGYLSLLTKQEIPEKK